MSRFVDADKLSEKITTEYCGKCGIYNGELCSSCPMNNALNYIDDFPTADVVPRAEADKWRLNLEAVLEERVETRADLSREIFEDLDDKIFHHVPDFYTLETYLAIKKKYTEEQ